NDRVSVSDYSSGRSDERSLLSCVDRKHEYAEWLLIVPFISNYQAAGVGAPGNVRRCVWLRADPNLGHFSFQSAQRRNQAHLRLARERSSTRRDASEKSDPAAIRRPDWILITARIGRDSQRSAGTNHLDINVEVILPGSIPHKRDLISVG